MGQRVINATKMQLLSAADEPKVQTATSETMCGTPFSLSTIFQGLVLHGI